MERIVDIDYTRGIEVRYNDGEYLVPDIFDNSIVHVTQTFDEACEVCDTLYKELDDLINF
jgi:hypothetical protein